MKRLKLAPQALAGTDARAYRPHPIPRITPPAKMEGGRLNIAFLKSLSEAAGVPGREERVRAIIQKNARDIFDNLKVDPMGSLIARKRGASKSANVRSTGALPVRFET